MAPSIKVLFNILWTLNVKNNDVKRQHEDRETISLFDD